MRVLSLLCAAAFLVLAAGCSRTADDTSPAPGAAPQSPTDTPADAAPTMPPPVTGESGTGAEMQGGTAPPEDAAEVPPPPPP